MGHLAALTRSHLISTSFPASGKRPGSKVDLIFHFIFGRLLENLRKSLENRQKCRYLIVCLSNKQNNTWLLVVRVQLHISFVRDTHLRNMKLNARREIPCVRMPMYYSPHLKCPKCPGIGLCCLK